MIRNKLKMSTLITFIQCNIGSEVKSLSLVRLFVNPWTVACQAPPSVEFSRQAYWSKLPLPTPQDLPAPGIEPGSPAMGAGSLPPEPPGKPWKQNHKRNCVW